MSLTTNHVRARCVLDIMTCAFGLPLSLQLHGLHSARIEKSHISRVLPGIKGQSLIMTASIRQKTRSWRVQAIHKQNANKNSLTEFYQFLSKYAKRAPIISTNILIKWMNDHIRS